MRTRLPSSGLLPTVRERGAALILVTAPLGVLPYLLVPDSLAQPFGRSCLALSILLGAVASVFLRLLYDRLGVALASVAALTHLAGLLGQLFDAPGVVLVDLLLIGTVVEPLIRDILTRDYRRPHRLPPEGAAAVLAFGGVLLAQGHGLTASPWAKAALLATLGLSVGLSTATEWRAQPVRDRRDWLRLSLLPMGALVLPAPRLALLLWSIHCAWTIWRTSQRMLREITADLYRNPAGITVLTFGLLCGLGALLLTFPESTTSGEGLSLLTATFTSVSAVCVTGLSTIDVGTVLSPFGQVVVLLLIQIGGLGMMTLSAFAALALGSRLALRETHALGEVVGDERPAAVRRLVRTIVIATLTIEGIGALLLFPALKLDGLATGEAVWHAVFHAVSAFCNAGFALYPDSLMSRNGLVVGVIGGLVVLGGLGFAVYASVIARGSGRRRRLDVHSKVVLWATGILLVSGCLLIAVLEWTNTLNQDGYLASLGHAAFESVTLRTAGFATIDYAQLRPATALVMLGFMFIGASPGGTGGGVKTTTTALLLLNVKALMSRTDVVIFGRVVPTGTLARATAIVTLSGAALFAVVVILVASQPLEPLMVVFEAFSAFGTVGLSQGVTAKLDALGQILIIALMFLGRTGPLTVALVFGRPSSPTRVRRVEEDLPVG